MIEVILHHMRSKNLLSLFAALSLTTAQSMAATNTSEAVHGMVASVHPIATDAGVNILKSGGNAVDAAVAVGLTLGVVDTPNSGIGGGCFMLIHLANGKEYAIDGREMAPSAAKHDMFIRDGKGDTELSQTGPLASGVPGEVAAFDYALKHFGKKSLSDVILPAADVAEKGFIVSRSYSERMKSVSNEMSRFEASKQTFFRNGAPIQTGELLKQPDLANTYRQMAQHGAKWFYKGPFAKAAGDWMKINGGLITANDFATYKIGIRNTIETTYRGFRVVSFPPPSSGGVHVLEILNILENFDLKSMDEITRLHVIAESMKLAFADRAYWLGDPDFVNVPKGLIDKTYATNLAHNISLEHTTPVTGHGQPPGWQSNFFKKHTTHFSVADDQGNWVACTATINTSFGSKVVIPGTGVVLNNEMDDFSVQPGVPNHFGLIGGEANSVAPGKRPLSSMSPTIVLKDGQPIISLGAAGGPKIISAVVQELVAMLDMGATPAEALVAPRIHQQWSPDELLVETAMPISIQDALAARGHKVKTLGALSSSQIVERKADGSGFIGAADTRSGGTAAGW